MRIYGRTTDENGKLTWQVVTTDANGRNDGVYLTWLAQALKLNLNESPFFGDWGIPAAASVAQQIAPDFYVSLTQRRFSKYFASVILSKVSVTGLPQTPNYRINVLTNQGYRLAGYVDGRQWPT